MQMAKQLRTPGMTVTIEREVYPDGRFARPRDPEGHPIESWEPRGGNSPAAR
jgi:hypothetical protein